MRKGQQKIIEKAEKIGVAEDIIDLLKEKYTIKELQWILNHAFQYPTKQIKEMMTYPVELREYLLKYTKEQIDKLLVIYDADRYSFTTTMQRKPTCLRVG